MRSSISYDVDMHVFQRCQRLAQSQCICVYVCMYMFTHTHMYFVQCILEQRQWCVAEEPIFAAVDSERLRTLGVLFFFSLRRLTPSVFAPWGY